MLNNKNQIFLSLLATLTLVFTPSPEFYSQTVNPIIGDESFLETYGKLPNDKTDNELRVKTHLKYVEEMLRYKDISHLSLELQAKRMQLLDLLHEYHQRGKFPENRSTTGIRKPCFIDDSGTICAIGYLIEQSADRDMAEALNSEFQYEEIFNMNSPILEKWIVENGFSKEEIAIIQPTYENWFPQPSRNSIGLRSGLMYSSISNKNFLDDVEPVFGFVGGFSLDHSTGRRSYFSIDFLYSNIGFSSPIIFTDELGLPSGGAELNYRYQYVSMPIRYGICGSNRLSPLTSIGISPSFLVKATNTYPAIDGPGNILDEPTTSELKNVPTFDLSLTVQVGVSCNLGKYKFQSYLELQQGLINQTDTDFFENSQIHHQGISLNFAIKHTI